jgi:hypothetical protein
MLSNENVQIIIESMSKRLHDLEVDKLKYVNNTFILIGIDAEIMCTTHYLKMVELLSIGGENV